MTHFIVSFLIAGIIGASSMGITTVSSHETITTSGNDTTITRGKKINEKGAISVTELVAKVKKDGDFEGKVKGKILEVCQKKGCWMVVDLENGDNMRVTFKDYGFFVPKDSPGGTIIMEGRAWTDTTHVDVLQHYAQDAGKSKEEIAAITEPEVKMVFEADGLILKK